MHIGEFLLGVSSWKTLRGVPIILLKVREFPSKEEKLPFNEGKFPEDQEASP